MAAWQGIVNAEDDAGNMDGDTTSSSSDGLRDDVTAMPQRSPFAWHQSLVRICRLYLTHIFSTIPMLLDFCLIFSRLVLKLGSFWQL